MGSGGRWQRDSSGPSAAADTSNTGRADQYVPVFSGRQAEYREFRRRCDLYEAKMRVAGREKETVFNIVTLLTGRAWDLIEDLSIDDLKKENAYATVCARLDAAFKFEPPDGVAQWLWGILCEASKGNLDRRCRTTPRTSSNAERKLKSSHSIDLPEKVRAWWYLRRSGGDEGSSASWWWRSWEKVAWPSTRPWRRWTSSWARTRSRKVHRDGIVERLSTELRRTMLARSWMRSMRTQLTGEEEWDEESEAYYAWTEEEEAYLAGDDSGDYDTEEFDEVYSAYVDAKQHLNRLRTSRGFYPVVANGSRATSSTWRWTRKGTWKEVWWQGWENVASRSLRREVERPEIPRDVDVMPWGLWSACDVDKPGIVQRIALRSPHRLTRSARSKPRTPTWWWSRTLTSQTMTLTRTPTTSQFRIKEQLPCLDRRGSWEGIWSAWWSMEWTSTRRSTSTTAARASDLAILNGKLQRFVAWCPSTLVAWSGRSCAMWSMVRRRSSLADPWWNG